jgi:hypothetical protein
MFDAAFDSRDRALRWAPFEFDSGSANKEDLGQRVAEFTREGLAGVGPEVRDGLYSRGIGGVDGDLWGGVLVEEELGLRDCAGEGGKVCIEGCGGGAQVADCVADFVAVAEDDCHPPDETSVALSSPEAENIAASHATKGVVWLRRVQ